MSGWNLLNANNSKTWIGIETTLGVTASTMIPITCDGDVMPLKGMTQKMLPNKSQRQRRHDPVMPVPGLENDSPVEFSVTRR